MNKSVKYPLVLVVWSDIQGSLGWKDESTVREWAKNEWQAKEPGYLIEKNKDYILLGSGWVESRGLFRSVVKIPRGCAKIYPLKEPKIKE